MDIKRTIKELSQNEKKVLLALKTLHGTGSPEDIFKNGDFDQEVEVANAASWLQSKKLVTIKDHITTVYSLGKEDSVMIISRGSNIKRAIDTLAILIRDYLENPEYRELLENKLKERDLKSDGNNKEEVISIEENNSESE